MKNHPKAKDYYDKIMEIREEWEKIRETIKNVSNDLQKIEELM